METLRFAIRFEREDPGRVWTQAGNPWEITRSVTDIHNDYSIDREKWVRGANNDIYKAHASLSPDGTSMVMFIEINAAYGSSVFWVALTMILNTKVFGSYISRQVTAYTIGDQLPELIDGIRAD